MQKRHHPTSSSSQRSRHGTNSHWCWPAAPASCQDREAGGGRGRWGAEMRFFLAKRLLQGALAPPRSRPPAAAASSVFSSTRRYAVAASLAQEEAETVTFPREGPGVSYGLNWALAGRGVFVKDKAFYNLKSSELQKNGAEKIERLSGLPVYVRGNAVSGVSEISKAQVSKLMKQVTTHISSIPSVFVQDGAVSSFSKCEAKVRIVSDSPSAVLSLSSIIWRTPTRVSSHDSCPLTVYVATSISPSIGEIIGLGSQASSGFLVGDAESSSLILCGKAFADAAGVKDALAALAAPIISARGGLPVSARALAFGDSLILMFASEETVESGIDLHENFVSADAGVVLSSYGVAPFFHSGESGVPNLFRKPSSVIFASADSSGVLPTISKLSPGQAAYHFLAGYQDGKFISTYSNRPSAVAPLELAKSLSHLLKENEIPSFLLNVHDGGKHIAGKDLVDLVKSTLTKAIPESSLGTSSDPKVGDMKEKYKSFLSGKFQELPEEFTI